MEPLEAKRPTTVVKCEKHGLHYDSTLMNGCVICRREAGGASPPPPRSLGRILTFGALLLVVILGGVYFLGKREPVRESSFEEPTPRASLPAEDTGGPVYSGAEGR
jgi:hypothetical protein